MMSTKQFRDLESKVHEYLFENIKLLTHLYPTTKDFDEVFKSDMFMNRNKAAFQHVTYYLFNIIDPELTKEKITAWPVYDMKLESSFRNQVSAFIIYINATYEYANIPHLMTSHFLSPGGFKFAKFMLKLSMFAMFEHLRRNVEDESVLLFPTMPHRDSTVTDIINKNIKCATNLECEELDKMCSEFAKKHEKAQLQAAMIVKEQQQLEQQLIHFQDDLESKQVKNTKDMINLVKNLEEKSLVLEEIQHFCEECIELFNHLESDGPNLEFSNNLSVPNCVKHLIRDDCKVLDLMQLFTSLDFLLENMNLEMPIHSIKELDEVKSLVKALNEKCLRFDQRVSQQKNNLVELSALNDFTKSK